MRIIRVSVIMSFIIFLNFLFYLRWWLMPPLQLFQSAANCSFPLLFFAWTFFCWGSKQASNWTAAGHELCAASWLASLRHRPPPTAHHPPPTAHHAPRTTAQVLAKAEAEALFHVVTPLAFPASFVVLRRGWALEKLRCRPFVAALPLTFFLFCSLFAGPIFPAALLSLICADFFSSQCPLKPDPCSAFSINLILLVSISLNSHISASALASS